MKTDLSVYLKNFKHSDKVIYVHKDCRCKFTHNGQQCQSTMSVLAKKNSVHPWVLHLNGDIYASLVHQESTSVTKTEINLGE